MQTFSELIDPEGHFLKCFHRSRSTVLVEFSQQPWDTCIPLFLQVEKQTQGHGITCQVPAASQGQSVSGPQACVLLVPGCPTELGRPVPTAGSIPEAAAVFPGISQLWDFSELQNICIKWEKEGYQLLILPIKLKKKKKTGLPWRLSDRVCLPVSIGDPVRALIPEDLACLRAAQPMCYSHQASALEAVLCKRSPLSEKPTPTTRE